MKLEAAIKKIRNRAKAVNREVQIEQHDHHNNGQVKVHVHFEGAESELTFWTNRDGTIGAPHIRRWNDHTDLHTDYFAGYHLDNITQALNTLTPLPPKYPVGSLVRFKDNKRMKRHKLAGIVALVVEASHGGHYKLQWSGSEHRYDPSYSERDIEKIS